MRSLKVLGTRIDALSSAQLQKALSFDASKIVISKVNTEFLHRANSNVDFLRALNASNLSIADGRGVLWAARYLSLPLQCKQFPITNFQLPITLEALWQMIYSGAAVVFNPKFITYPIFENIPGVEALKIMLRAAKETDSGVFFFGATQEDLDGAIANIKLEIAGLKISGSLNGYDFQSDKRVDPVSIINQTDAKLLIVALGSPMQEYWIRDNIERLKNIRVAVGEGGTLDRIANPSQMAPKWMNNLGLEWLWRLFMNKSLTDQAGSRLRRAWNAVPVFIFEVVKWKIKYGATEVK